MTLKFIACTLRPAPINRNHFKLLSAKHHHLSQLTVGFVILQQNQEQNFYSQSWENASPAYRTVHVYWCRGWSAV